MPEFFNKAMFLANLQDLWQQSGLSKMEFYDKIGIRNAFSVYAPAKPGQKQRKVNAPSAETLLRISQLFHVSVDWLLTGQDGPPVPSSSFGEVTISLPAGDALPASPQEKQLLEKAFIVLRAEDAPGNPAQALAQNIEALHASVAIARSGPKPDASPTSGQEAAG